MIARRACINSGAIRDQRLGGLMTRYTQAWGNYCLQNNLPSDFMISLILRRKLDWPTDMPTLSLDLPVRADGEPVSVYEDRCVAALNAAFTAERVRRRLADGAPAE